MGLLRRAAPLPDAVRPALGRARPLAWVTDTAGTTGVVVGDRLVLAAPDGAVREIPWTALDGAEWDADTSTLTVREIDGASVTLRLPEHPRRFMLAVRERIEASLVHVVQREIPGGGVVRAAIRRAASGELTSQVSVLGTARNDAVVSGLAAEVEAEARAAVGLPV